MKINKKKSEIKNLTSPERKQKLEQKQGWYFINFSQDLPHNRPYGFTLYDEPFVLFRNKENKLVCYALSLEDEAKITNSIYIKSFSVVEKQGMIWFWRGKSEEADENLISNLTYYSQKNCSLQSSITSNDLII